MSKYTTLAYRFVNCKWQTAQCQNIIETSTFIKGISKLL